MSTGKSDNILENINVEQQSSEDLRSCTMWIFVDAQFVRGSIVQVQ